MATTRPESSAQPLPMPPPDMQAVQCACGAWYLDVTVGRESHVTVFGHKPERVQES